MKDISMSANEWVSNVGSELKMDAEERCSLALYAALPFQNMYCVYYDLPTFSHHGNHTSRHTYTHTHTRQKDKHRPDLQPSSIFQSPALIIVIPTIASYLEGTGGRWKNSRVYNKPHQLAYQFHRTVMLSQVVLSKHPAKFHHIQ